MADGAQVLLVEDDLAMQRLVTKWATGAGYEVTSVRNGRDAMTMIETCCPQIVLTSRDMPVLDGLELCRWLRSQTLPRYIYTIVCTSRCAAADVRRCLEAGADDILRKPLDRADLFMRLRNGLRIGELEQRLSDASQLDRLTGLPSQRKFFETLRAESSRAKRYGAPLCCVAIDIDRFREVNDSHGRTLGDVVIRTVAEILKENTREIDVIGRLGGDAFGVMLPETNEGQTLTWAERVRKAIAKRNMSVRERELSFRISLGVAQHVDASDEAGELLERARQALLLAKRAGRDRVVGYSAATVADPLAVDWRAEGSPPQTACRDVMTPLSGVLEVDAKISVAGEFFSTRQVEAAAVVSSGAMVGVVTAFDVMGAMMDASWRQRPVQDLLRTEVARFDERELAISAHEFLARVPAPFVVVAAQEQPVGLITRAAALRWYVESLKADEINRASESAPALASADVGV